MFVFDLFKIIILLVTAYLIAVLYKDYLPIDKDLADWIMKLMSNKEAIIISYLALTLILILLKNTIKRLKLTICNRKNIYKYKKWQGIILIVLIFVLFFLLITEYKYYLILPLFTFLVIEYIRKIK